MAAGSSLLACVALFVCAFLDLLPWGIALEGVAIIGGITLVFCGDLQERAQPPLHRPRRWRSGRSAVAILFVAYILYRAGPAREGLVLLYPLALLFGVLRLSAKRLMLLAVLAIAAHGTVLHLSYLHDDYGQMDPDTAIAEFAVLMIVLPWFAVMGGYVNRLRLRLTDTNRELSDALERIEQLAIRDELTGGYNRRFMIDALARERSRAERLREPFSVCLLDIDHFKSVNDTLGHAAGDAVLQAAAEHRRPGAARRRRVRALRRRGVPAGAARHRPGGRRRVAERVRAAVRRPSSRGCRPGVASR